MECHSIFISLVLVHINIHGRNNLSWAVFHPIWGYFLETFPQLLFKQWWKRRGTSSFTSVNPNPSPTDKSGSTTPIQKDLDFGVRACTSILKSSSIFSLCSSASMNASLASNHFLNSSTFVLYQGHYPVLAFLYHRDRLLRYYTKITSSALAHQGKNEGRVQGGP